MLASVSLWHTTMVRHVVLARCFLSSRAACAQGKADATWVFLGHEGVQAEMDCVNLNIFKLADHGIPYGFTPVLVANPETLRCVHIPLPSCACYALPRTFSSQAIAWVFCGALAHTPVLGCETGPVISETCVSCRQRQSSMRAFLRATSRGYQAAAADPQRAADMLVEESQGALNPDFARKSQEFACKVDMLLHGFD